MTKKTAVKPDIYETIMVQVKEIGRYEPSMLQAISTVLTIPLESIRQGRIARGATNRRLITRLQRRHDCDHAQGGRFEQISPLYGTPRWRCLGCDQIVMLED